MIRVVLVEDQAMVRGAFARLLGLEPDIEVVAVAENGEQGLAAVTEHLPDILLTDIEMPGMTGLELAARLKGNPKVRVVIVTTFARTGYLRRALDAGVSGYVLKDSPIEHLAYTLRRVSVGNRVIAPELAVSAWTGSDPLTDREREVLREVGEGHTNVEIAQKLHLAEGTVRNYLSAAITKLGARNRAEAFAKAQEMGYL
ncbi:MAG: response regulator transcription factor [Anaerolineales bacterium]|nr:response regulator transcription factor [Anaerolineales bacterium]MCW5854599.1 response regulator transcription factor [Anaerolineales bacterium]